MPERQELAPGHGQGPLCLISHPEKRGDRPDTHPTDKETETERGCPTPPCSGPRVAHTSYISRLVSVFRLESLSALSAPLWSLSGVSAWHLVRDATYLCPVTMTAVPKCFESSMTEAGKPSQVAHSHWKLIHSHIN